MGGRVVLAVGNGMMGDDGAGPKLAQRLQAEPLSGWTVVNGGSAPENQLYLLRELAPELVVIVDAAEMGLEPGQFRQVDEQEVASELLLTTHSLPLSFLMQSIRTFVPQVMFIGIQPELVAFGYPMSPGVKAAVDQVYESFKNFDQVWELPIL